MVPHFHRLPSRTLASQSNLTMQVSNVPSHSLPRKNSNYSYDWCSRRIPLLLRMYSRNPMRIYSSSAVDWYPASQHRVQYVHHLPALKLMHTFLLLGKILTYDMYRSIERLTNNTGIQMARSRYRPTMRCLTQWRHLKALKRGGRAHSNEGASGTLNGELAILCPSCPHPGINLPTDWDMAPKEKR